MSRYKHLFIMDPIESLNMKLDTTLRISRSLFYRGDEIYFCQPINLSWNKRENCATAYIKKLQFKDRSLNNITVSNDNYLKLNDFNAIHMRKDPPFDMDYITCTWLIESAQNKTRIYNSPSALRGINEKLAIFRFPGEIEEALVSHDPKQLLKFIINNCKGDAICKPLTLFGGRGIVRLKFENKENPPAEIKKILIDETNNGKSARLIQPFNDKIFKGEIRVFTVGGKSISWCLKKPDKGNYLANTSSGATLNKYEPTKNEIIRIEKIASSMLKDGVYFVGFDIIGEHLSEINITSPRLLQATDDQSDYYETISDWISNDLKMNTN